MASAGGRGMPAYENISRTLDRKPPPVTTNRAAERCGYIGEEGLACGRAAVRGSAYCPRHRALCQVAPGTREAAAIAAELQREAGRAPPLGVRHDAVPEPLEPTEPGDALAALDLPRREPEEAQ